MNDYAKLSNYMYFLKDIGKMEIPLAVRGTLNKCAFEGRKNLSQVQMRSQFTLRNDFENKKSLHYEGSKGELDIRKMEATFGQKAVVQFRTGAKQMDDLFQQETGGIIKARAGSKLRRVPFNTARVSQNFAKPVARVNQPTGGGHWLKDTDILPSKAYGSMTPLERVKSAHVRMVRRWKESHGDNPIYMLPSKNDPTGEPFVFRVKAGKPVSLMSLRKDVAHLKKHETVKPAGEFVVNKAGEYFVEQAHHRFLKAAMRRGG
jgi:hypothetical protein